MLAQGNFSFTTCELRSKLSFGKQKCRVLQCGTQSDAWIEALKWRFLFLIACPVAYLVKVCVTLAVSSNVITEKTVLQTYFNIISSFVAFCAFLIIFSV